MTNSSFNYAPGLLIWHSTDLVNWTPIARALHALDGSVYAPDLVKYKGRYYIYYPAAGANYVVYADDIRGPWSQPVKLDLTGIDWTCSGRRRQTVFICGQRCHSPAKRRRAESDGTEKDRLRRLAVPQGLENRRQWRHVPRRPETAAQGRLLLYGIGRRRHRRTGTSHMVVVARSKSVFGPWENSPYNPLVHTYNASDPWWSKGHGTLIDDAEGLVVVYHAYAQGYHTLVARR